MSAVPRNRVHSAVCSIRVTMRTIDDIVFPSDKPYTKRTVHIEFEIMVH